MALKVNTAIRRPGIFVVAPSGRSTPPDMRSSRKRSPRLNQNPDVIIFDMEFTDYINSMESACWSNQESHETKWG